MATHIIDGNTIDPADPISVHVENTTIPVTPAALQDLVPNGIQADQRLTVDATAGGVQFAAFHADTTHVIWSAEAAEVRVTFDSSAPTSTNGHIIPIGTTGVWAKALAVAAKFIRTGGTSGIIHASQVKTP
jgi:hypothetical protein